MDYSQAIWIILIYMPLIYKICKYKTEQRNYITNTSETCVKCWNLKTIETSSICINFLFCTLVDNSSLLMKILKAYHLDVTIDVADDIKSVLKERPIQSNNITSIWIPLASGYPPLSKCEEADQNSITNTRQQTCVNFGFIQLRCAFVY